MSTVKANTYQDASGGSNAILYGAASPAGSMGFRNRIINGDMRIDQRNAGAAVTVNDNNTFFAVDRFFGVGESSDGVFTLQQNTSAPSGFVNSIKATVTTTDASIGSTQRYYVSQRIEGLNCSDLAWGTANAKTVVLSFWVRSSLTGLFGGSIINSDNTRSYPFTYTINAADTWEQKSVTIVGDTTGTWLTTNGIGIKLQFALGAGSSVQGTAGSWSGSLYWSATGATNLISTNGATFYITGVQLEVGSVATEFERRPYGTELALCQRYYSKSGTIQTAAFTTFGDQLVNSFVFYPPTRATPSVSVYSSNTNTVDKLYEPATGNDVGGTVQNIYVTSAQIRTSGYSPTVGRNYIGYIIVSSEL